MHLNKYLILIVIFLIPIFADAQFFGSNGHKFASVVFEKEGQWMGDSTWLILINPPDTFKSNPGVWIKMYPDHSEYYVEAEIFGSAMPHFHLIGINWFYKEPHNIIIDSSLFIKINK